MYSATHFSLAGDVWTLVWRDSKGWGKGPAGRDNVAPETGSLSEAAHCRLTPEPLRAVRQQGLAQGSWKMSQLGKLPNGPCFLVLMFPCVRRAVWTGEAGTGKGRRGQDVGRGGYSPPQPPQLWSPTTHELRAMPKCTRESRNSEHTHTKSPHKCQHRNDTSSQPQGTVKFTCGLGPFSSQLSCPSYFGFSILASWPHSEIRETKSGLLEQVTEEIWFPDLLKSHPRPHKLYKMYTVRWLWLINSFISFMYLLCLLFANNCQLTYIVKTNTAHKWPYNPGIY